MAAILIVAHAPLASTMRQLVAHVMPDAQDAVVAIDVDPDLPADGVVRRLREEVERRAGADVLVLGDVYGATPCNLAASLCSDRVRVLAGLNLSMLWRAVAHRNDPIADLERIALDGARQGIMKLGATSPQNQARRAIADGQDHHHHSQ